MPNDLHMSAKAWPFEQARQILKRLDIEKKRGIDRGDKPVIFETGYGPSGLPHIGTFGEVVRTTMVMNAFIALTEGKVPTKLICVSDDMDGMRKVPPTVPNPESLEQYLQKPLTDVPDPFGTHESYGAHMNARLRAFLDSFGFAYEFASATELYRSGRYDPWLLKALEKFEDIMGVMLPTLGEERRATYSPFLPISPTSGRVLYVPMKSVDAKAGTITFDDDDGSEVTLPVTGGHVKLQWKPDFGMRWAALGVDFEMFGKDHQDNAPIYSRICKILGGQQPVQYVYELFLDEKGEKISKSKGNGISVEDWLKYAPQESLSLFNFAKPRAAKKLYFDVIPKNVDEYFTYAVRYYQDFVKPNKDYRAPTDQERAALTDLTARLKAVPEAEKADGEALQTLIFSVGKDHEFENLRNWFKAIYEVCLGQSQGPRFGSFVAIYGPEETAQLIEDALAGTLG